MWKSAITPLIWIYVMGATGEAHWSAYSYVDRHFDALLDLLPSIRATPPVGAGLG